MERITTSHQVAGRSTKLTRERINHSGGHSGVQHAHLREVAACGVDGWVLRDSGHGYHEWMQVKTLSTRQWASGMPQKGPRFPSTGQPLIAIPWCEPHQYCSTAATHWRVLH